MKAHPAQVDNLAVQKAVEMLNKSRDMLWGVALGLSEKPSPKRRAEMRRRLSGVLANVEIVRQAIKE